MGVRRALPVFALFTILAASTFTVNPTFGDSFISEHLGPDFPHEHEKTVPGITHTDDGIDYVTTCLQDQEFETEFLEDGITPNPNYLREDVGAYVFFVMGWGGWPMPGLPDDFPLVPEKQKEQHEIIQWLYDNNAQVIRGDWTWLPVDAVERYGVALGPNENGFAKIDQTPESFRCHQAGPNNAGELDSIVDSLIKELGITELGGVPSAWQGPIHDPAEWNLIVGQWKNLMAKQRTQELIEDRKVIVWGHSFGGNAVSQIGRDTETRIDLLAIADPVGHRALRYNTIYEANCGTEDFGCTAPNVISTTLCDFALQGPPDSRSQINNNVKNLMQAWQVGFGPPFDFEALPWSKAELDSAECITVDDPVGFFFGLGSNPVPTMASLAKLDLDKVGYQTSGPTNVIYQRQLNELQGPTSHPDIWLVVENNVETGKLSNYDKSFIVQLEKMNNRPELSVTSTTVQETTLGNVATIEIEAIDSDDNDNLTFHVLDKLPSEFTLQTAEQGDSNIKHATLTIPLSGSDVMVAVGVEDDGWPCFGCKDKDTAPTINGETKLNGGWDALTIHITNQEDFTVITSADCPEDSIFNGNHCSVDGIVDCPPGLSFNPITETCTAKVGKICTEAGTKVALDGLCVKQACPAGMFLDPIFTENCFSLVCPSGFGYDPVLKNCFQFACPTGSTWAPIAQTCRADACPFGFGINLITGLCDKIFEPSIPHECPDGTDFNGIECLGQHNSCPAGSSFNNISGNCEAAPSACPAGTDGPNFLGACLTSNLCPDNTSPNLIPGPVGDTVAQRCEASPDLQCPPPIGEDKGLCVFPHCPNGGAFDGNVCKNSACPGGFGINDAEDTCEQSARCPVGSIKNPQGVFPFCIKAFTDCLGDPTIPGCSVDPFCPGGTTRDGFTCTLDEPPCTDWPTTTRSGGDCIFPDPTWLGGCDSSLCEGLSQTSCPIGEIYSPIDPQCRQTFSILTVPEDITVDGTSSGLIDVDIGEATVTGGTDTNPTITNNAPDLFPLGTTVVTWTVEDNVGASFSDVQLVTVTLSFESLVDEIKSLNLPKGIEKSLIAKVEASLNSFEKDNPESTLNLLTAFKNYVMALDEKKLDPQDAENLIRIADSLPDFLFFESVLP